MAILKAAAPVEVVVEVKALGSGDDIVIASVVTTGDDRDPEAHPYLADIDGGAPIHVLYLALQLVRDVAGTLSLGHEVGPEGILRALRLLRVSNKRTTHHIRVHSRL